MLGVLQLSLHLELVLWLGGSEWGFGGRGVLHVSGMESCGDSRLNDLLRSIESLNRESMTRAGSGGGAAVGRVAVGAFTFPAAVG